MRATLQRSGALMAGSARALRADRRLLLLPLLVFPLVVVELFGFYGISILFGTDDNFRQFIRKHSIAGLISVGPRGTVLALAALFVIHVTVVFLQAGITAIVLNPLLASHEEAPSRLVRRRSLAIFEWCVLAATVLFVAQRVQSATGILGRFLSFLPRLLWAGASFFAIPVILCEEAGPFRALRRSASLFASTWGEELAAGFSLLVLSVPAMALIGLCAGVVLLLDDSTAAALVVVILWLGWSVILTSILAAFQAALYAHAVGLPPVPGFEGAPVADAYQRKRAPAQLTTV